MKVSEEVVHMVDESTVLFVRNTLAGCLGMGVAYLLQAALDQNWIQGSLGIIICAACTSAIFRMTQTVKMRKAVGTHIMGKGKSPEQIATEISKIIANDITKHREENNEHN